MICFWQVVGTFECFRKVSGTSIAIDVAAGCFVYILGQGYLDDASFLVTLFYSVLLVLRCVI